MVACSSRRPRAIVSLVLMMMILEIARRKSRKARNKVPLFAAFEVGMAGSNSNK
jgi:hypothetical protein